MSSEANGLTVLRVSCARARQTSLRLEVFISKIFTAMAVALLAGTGTVVTVVAFSKHIISSSILSDVAKKSTPFS